MGHITPVRSGLRALEAGPSSVRGSQASARRKLAEASRAHNGPHANHQQVQREHEELRRTFYEVAQMQRRLCGPRYLRCESYEIAGEIFPLRDLSGDFVSIFQCGDDLVFAIGDIAGKGLRAALWFSHVVSALRLQCQAHEDPAAALAALNRDLLNSGTEFPLTSLFLGRLNVTTGEITYCNAGHPPALVVRAAGETEKLQEGGPVLAVVPGVAFSRGKIHLQYGDTLLSYSDGIPECRDWSGTEFGMARLVALAEANRGTSANSTLFSVLAGVEDFAGHQTREDDMALLVVHRAEM